MGTAGLFPGQGLTNRNVCHRRVAVRAGVVSTGSELEAEMRVRLTAGNRPLWNCTLPSALDPLQK